jgi:hypothetical protein
MVFAKLLHFQYFSFFYICYELFFLQTAPGPRSRMVWGIGLDRLDTGTVGLNPTQGMDAHLLFRSSRDMQPDQATPQLNNTVSSSTATESNDIFYSFLRSTCHLP